MKKYFPRKQISDKEYITASDFDKINTAVIILRLDEAITGWISDLGDGFLGVRFKKRIDTCTKNLYFWDPVVDDIYDVSYLIYASALESSKIDDNLISRLDAWRNYLIECALKKELIVCVEVEEPDTKDQNEFFYRF